MARRLGDHRRDLLALAALWLLLTVTFADVLFARATFFDRDLARFYYPTKMIFREIVAGGELPLWNPYYSAGQPMAANPEYEVFYPLQWLVLAPDYHLGFSLHIVVHFYLAATGMYLFLRSRASSIAASLWGAVAFALGGWLLSSTSLLPILFGASWIPLILLFVTRFVERWRRADFTLAAVLVGVQALTGEPTTLVQTWALLVAFACWPPGAPPVERSVLLRRALASAAVVVVGLLVGSPQILPALDFVRDTVRADGLSFAAVSQWSMHPLRPLELAFPHLFGVASAEGEHFWGYRLYPGQGYPYLLSLYFGVCALALALAGVASRVRGWALVTGLTVASYLLAIGSHTPLLRLLYDARLVQSLRYPEKFSLLGVMALTVCSALAFDQVRAGNRRLLTIATGLVGGATALAVAGALCAHLDPGYPSLFLRLWRLPLDAVTVGYAEASLRAWDAAAVRAALVLLALLLCRYRRGAAWLLLVLLAVDLGVLARTVAPSIDESYFSAPRIIRSLDPPAPKPRIFHQADWHDTSRIARDYLDAPGARYWVFRNGAFPRMPATWGFPSVLEKDYDLTNLRSTESFVRSMWEVRGAGQERWLEMFTAMSAAGYRALYRPPGEGWSRGRVREVEPVALVELDAHPRYWFADRVVRVETAEDFRDRLTAGDWTPRTAYLADRSVPCAPGRMLASSERSSSVDLDLEASDDALLVLSITGHRYWQARLDGHRVPVIPANLTYMGVEIPPGRHRLTLRYRNPLVIASLAISGCTLITLLVAGMRRQPHSSRGKSR